MSRLRSHGLAITILGAAMGGIGAFWDWRVGQSSDAGTILTVLGVLVCVVGALLQHNESRAFTTRFRSSDWARSENKYVLRIQFSKHRKSAPIVMLREESGSQFFTDVFVDEATKEVVIKVLQPCEGFVTIK